MDPHTSLLLNLTYFHQDKSMDELRQSLLLTMELEDTRLQALEELKARDQEIAHLKNLLAAAIRDKDEALEKCQKLMFHRLPPHSALSSVDEDHRNNAAFSSSDCDESIVSSPANEAADHDLPLLIDRPLPEKGKFLQAVMKAGPLLQTLLLAGPLPQWRHPPPPLDSYQIPPPPVVIPSPPAISTNQDTFDNNNNCSSMMNRKRRMPEISPSAMNELKYQRVLLQ